jgi:hypothetical protein
MQEIAENRREGRGDQERPVSAEDLRLVFENPEDSEKKNEGEDGPERKRGGHGQLGQRQNRQQREGRVTEERIGRTLVQGLECVLRVHVVKSVPRTVKDHWRSEVDDAEVEALIEMSMSGDNDGKNEREEDD